VRDNSDTKHKKHECRYWSVVGSVAQFDRKSVNQAKLSLAGKRQLPVRKERVHDEGIEKVMWRVGKGDSEKYE
jgi:hypothetical protein